MARRSPYQGLDPFGEEDADFFFGRERDIRLVVANVFASSVTVLQAASGVGKTSLLDAGVVPGLRSREGVVVAVCHSWSGDAVEQTRSAVVAGARALRIELTAGRTLAESVDECVAQGVRRIVAILDQFEDYFIGGAGDESLMDELADGLALSHGRLSLLLSIREESLAKLDLFEGRLPGLFDAIYRLDHLDRVAAEAAVVGPQEVWNARADEGDRFQLEPGVVDAVLDGVPARRAGTAGAVEEAHMQLVLERMWEAERGKPARPVVLRSSTLDDLGGPEGIVGAHVAGALGALSAAERERAEIVLDRLVTPSGERLQQRASDLAVQAHVDEPVLLPLLERLSGARVLRPVAAPDGIARYEIFNDLLSDPVLAWLGERRLVAERRRVKRWIAVAAALAVALAAVTGLAAYAWIQRETAHSRELSAQAQRLLDVDPLAGLALAVNADDTRGTSAAGDALRELMAESRERAVLRDGVGPVAGAFFDADGSHVLTAGSAGLLRSWPRAGGRPTMIRDRLGNVASTAACPGGARVAISTGDKPPVVVSVESRTVVTLRPPAQAAPTNVIACGGALAATADLDGNVRVYDARSGVLREALDASALGPLDAVALSPGDDLLVTGGEFGAIVWRLRGATKLARLEVPPGTSSRQIASVAFDPSGDHVVTGGGDGAVRIWETKTGRPLDVLEGNERVVRGIAVSPDGALVASAGADRTARIWDATTGELVLVLRGHRDALTSVAFSGDGRAVVTAAEDGTARVWESGIVSVLRGHTSRVRSAAFGPRGTLIATGSDDGTVRIWDAARGRTVAVLPGRPEGGEAHVFFAPDGRHVAAIGGDGALRVWDAAGRGRPVVVGGPDSPVFAAAVSPDGTRIVTAVGDNTVRMVGLDGGTIRTFRLGTQPIAVAFGPGGDRIAVGTFPDGRISIVEASSGATLASMNETHPEIGVVAFSPDGKLLVTGGADNVARIWDAKTGELRRALRGHDDAVLAASFSPDNLLVLTAGAEGTIRLWDARTGMALAELPGTEAAFSRDGRVLVGAGPGATARVYECLACGSLSDIRRRAKRLLDAVPSAERRSGD